MHELDNKKVCYDLAMTYAKVSLQYAKEHKFIYEPLINNFEFNELEYLWDKFTAAYAYYSNCDFDASVDAAVNQMYDDPED